MIVVTAPTSQIGRQVVDRLLAAGAPIRVIARDPERLAPRVRDRVEIVAGSHGDAEIVQRAFAGAEQVFWLVPADPRANSVEAAYVGFTRPAAATFRTAGVRRVVGISALGRGTPWAAQAGYVTGSLAVDDLIAASGVDYRALTMPSFMDNLLRQVRSIREEGVFVSPIAGDRKMPSVATADIAAVAARLLLDPSWRGTAEQPVLGAADISFEEMAAIMSEVLGRPVAFRQVPFAAQKARLMSFGSSEAMAEGVVAMAAAKDAGLDNGVVRTAGNTTPTTFRMWCETVLRPAILG